MRTKLEHGDEYSYLFKVVLIGNAGVGKTCLVRKFTQGVFPPGQSATIGVDFMIKTLKVGNEKVKLQIWDTAGQERFRSITQSYYRSAHAIVLVYDLSCQPTFDCISEWLNEIEQYANKKALKILVGNKTDKEDDREIPTHIAQTFAEANGFHYFIETSAVSAANVEALFQEVATQLTNSEMAKSADRHNGSGGYGRSANPPRTGASGILSDLIERTQQQQAQCCSAGGRNSGG